MARAAIVGCGMIAGLYEDFDAPGTYSHAKAYRRHGAFDMIGLCDPNAERRGVLGTKSDGRVFASLTDMLDQMAPDVVSLCTPDDLHAQGLETLLTHPRRPSIVFCEKPVCTDRQQMRHLIELEKASGSTVIVNHSRRFDPAHQALKQLIAGGTLGKFVQGHVDYYGGWRHLGVHIVDILQYFLECDFVPETTSWRCPSKYSDDPTLDVDGHFGGARLRFSGYPEPFYQIVDIALLFEAGQIKINDFGQDIQVLRKTVNTAHENVLIRDPNFDIPGMRDPIVHAVALIAEVLADGNRSRLAPFGLAEAQRTMETLWKGCDLHASRPD